MGLVFLLYELIKVSMIGLLMVILMLTTSSCTKQNHGIVHKATQIMGILTCVYVSIDVLVYTINVAVQFINT